MYGSDATCIMRRLDTISLALLSSRQESPILVSNCIWCFAEPEALRCASIIQLGNALDLERK